MNKALEIRIDSADDARSAVRHVAQITKAVKDNNLEGINFVVAKEVLNEAMRIMAGVFRVHWQRSTRTVQSPGDVLYQLPHWVMPETKPRVATTPPVARRGPGRPKKVVADASNTATV